jgi:hypothetical protein
MPPFPQSFARGTGRGIPILAEKFDPDGSGRSAQSSSPEKDIMHNLMIGLLFVAFVLCPCVVAALSRSNTEDNL